MSSVILDKKLEKITFEDIVSFCSEGYPEGPQLDYKSEKPSKGFAKHFAAFSNSRGGLLIIGIVEDKATGIPEKWEGIKKDAKLIEQIHQNASNVDPFPVYEICFTNEVNNKCFLLIRIMEGDQTPYYVFNDPNIWVRTGNIKKAIDSANPKQVEILFGKKNKAELYRSLLIKQADETFNAGLQNAERERLSNIAEEKRKYDEEIKIPKQNGLIVEPFKPTTYLKELGAESSMCKVILMPFFPNQILAKPNELKEMAAELNVRQQYDSQDVTTTPYGIINFLWFNHNGYIECHQIFSNGLNYYNSDVEEGYGEKGKVIMLGFIVGAFYRILRSTKNYYEKTGYNGGIVGSIELNDVAGMRIREIVPNNFISSRNRVDCLLPNYYWGLKTDTSVLSNPEKLKNWFYDNINNIYIYLGLAAPQETLLDSFCTQESISFE